MISISLSSKHYRSHFDCSMYRGFGAARFHHQDREMHIIIPSHTRIHKFYVHSTIEVLAHSWHLAPYDNLSIYWVMSDKPPMWSYRVWHNVCIFDRDDNRLNTRGRGRGPPMYTDVHIAFDLKMSSIAMCRTVIGKIFFISTVFAGVIF